MNIAKGFFNTLNNKKGGHIVEAAISLPIFIIAIMTMSAVILIYACIEDANFIIANELRRASIESNFLDTKVLVPSRVGNAISRNSQLKNYSVNEYIYRGKKFGNDEMIALNMGLQFNVENPIGIKTDMKYELSLVTRAYVGKKRKDEPMSASTFGTSGADSVFVFPGRGERYHKFSCKVLRAASTSIALTNGIKKKYHPCALCKSKNIKIGELVFIFPNYGRNYHKSSCKSLQRNYIEMERKVAKKRGYTPCQKCGG